MTSIDDLAQLVGLIECLDEPIEHARVYYDLRFRADSCHASEIQIDANLDLKVVFEVFSRSKIAQYGVVEVCGSTFPTSSTIADIAVVELFQERI